MLNKIIHDSSTLQKYKRQFKKTDVGILLDIDLLSIMVNGIFCNQILAAFIISKKSLTNFSDCIR